MSKKTNTQFDISSLEKTGCSKANQSYNKFNHGIAVKRTVLPSITIAKFNGCMQHERIFIDVTNELIDESSPVAATIESFILYKNVKWIIKNYPVARDISKRFFNDETNEQKKYFETKLLKVRNENTDDYLKSRDIFFRNCCALTYKIENVIRTISTDNKFTKINTNEFFSLAFGIGKCTDSKSLSRYIIKNIYPELIRNISERFGNDFEILLAGLLPHLTKRQASAESEFLTLNITTLIEQYRKTIQNENSTRYSKYLFGKEVKILEDSDATENRNCVLKDYIRLIKTSAIGMKSYHGDENCAKIIELLLDDYPYTDAEIAMKLVMSDRMYTNQKNNAYDIFGTLLWGCNALVLMQIYQ